MWHRFAYLLTSLLAVQHSRALRRGIPSLRKGGAEEQKASGSSSLAVNVEGKSDPVSLLWLRTAWIKSEQDRMHLKDASLRSLETGVVNNFSIHNAGGMFAGMEYFNHALTTDLDETLARELANCPLETMGGKGAWRRGNISAGRIWIFVNGETSMGYQFWNWIAPDMLPGDRGVIVGNWWNETHEEFESPQVTSIWVPFASTSFAERRYRTPMDLWNRNRNTRFNRKRKYLLGYQQTCCWSEREAFWDEVNHVAGERLNETGKALGKCNGNMELGERLSLPDGPSDGPYRFSGHMDSSMGRYENFRFVFSAEHGENYMGYISEKIVNAFLAGAVPIYFGAQPELLDQVFVPDTYILTSMRKEERHKKSLELFTAAAEDPRLYERLLHRSEPLVTEASMRRFFSWHPDVWPHFGDELRRRILMAALKKCKTPGKK
mmetsp:Transcript_30515/g.72161  ORF Transcript_30515/g.72161 Transcript_30515/m.72161 type:complete len:435 (+) Transcript_30515:122-1426(+)